MAEIEEFQPTDDSLLRFDGTVLEVFAGSVSGRFHVRGIEDLQVSEGFGKSLMIKNRFGSDTGLSYDKGRLLELQEFAERVMAVVRDQA